MPKVTVITPNYNYAHYLPKRLDSIFGQTFQDFELIILDNASTDNSREIIKSYAIDPRVQTVFNERNNGSTFKQWNLGLSRARGDYVWFAEADDYADPALLETLVDRLDRHPNVGMACCQSWVIDEHGQIVKNQKELQTAYDGIVRHHSTYDPAHWEQDYLVPGRDECLVYLYHLNTIPNASAVLLRRSLLEEIGGAPTEMLVCGDWMAYAKILLKSDLAFVAAPLNYFRQHQGTVRSKLSRGTLPHRETRLVQRFLREHLADAGLIADYRDNFRGSVGYLIHLARKPPNGKVPYRDAMELLRWFARYEPAVLKVALPMLAREYVADLSRRFGLLGAARRIQGMLASGKRSCSSRGNR